MRDGRLSQTIKLVTEGSTAWQTFWSWWIIKTIFVSGALGFGAAKALEGPIAARVEQALAGDWRVIFTRDTHGPIILTPAKAVFAGPHCLQGSGAGIYTAALRLTKPRPTPASPLWTSPPSAAPGLPAPPKPCAAASRVH